MIIDTLRILIPTLDLHGKRYHEVPELVSEFILSNQNSCPIMIICGNSPEMVEVAMDEVNKINCAKVKENYVTFPNGKSQFRYGTITILRV